MDIKDVTVKDKVGDEVRALIFLNKIYHHLLWMGILFL